MTACCYCGATEGINADAYGVWGCTDANAERCQLRCALLDAQDEYAALAAGLDAVVAEYEFRRDGLTAAWQQMHIAYKLAAARADAAEAQLGTAREDGARSMLAFVARHGFCDRERFLLIRIDADKDDWPLGWRSTAPTEADTVLAVWRGHETKEGRGGD